MQLFFRILVLCILVVSVTLRGDDPPGAVIPSGPHRGERLDTREMRTLRPATPEEEASYRQSPDDVIVTDFKHEGKFWTARIPADAVEDVILHKVIFAQMTLPVLGRVPRDVHEQIRFKLKPGKEIELFPQPGSTDRPVKSKINDVVFSADALGTNMNRLFNPARSFTGEYVLARQVMSTQDSWGYFVGGLKFQVEQFRVPLDEKRKQKAFTEAIRASRDIGYGELFNIFNHNCATAANSVLDAGARTRARMPGTGFLSGIPNFPWLALKLRGLARNAESLPTLNDELAELREDKGTMARGRAQARGRIAAKRLEDQLAAEGEKSPSFLKGACRYALSGIF